jgi:hypothetical protein
MQLSELIQRLSKLHDIHGDLLVADVMEYPIEEVTYKSHGEFTDAPYIEIESDMGLD